MMLMRGSADHVDVAKRIDLLMKPLSLLILGACLLVFPSCHRPKTVETSFYYWKTVYKTNTTAQSYLKHFKVRKLYVRITDVGPDSGQNEPVPVSPVSFADKLPDSLELVPVVFLENAMFHSLSQRQLQNLSENIARFVSGKVKQSGKSTFRELQIDCDWTASTRKSYFYLLKQLTYEPELKGKIISATLRLHQLKNRVSSGIPPVNRVVLMCYNMGNLRKYGSQNSILDIDELKRYVNQNTIRYPMPVDIALPLFNWAVVFRNKEYTGISKRIKIVDLNNKNQFIFIGNNIYRAVADLPGYGLLKGDEVRWEDVSTPKLMKTAAYLSSLLKTDTVNVIYFHLDENVLAARNFADLEKVDNLFH
jgi:hypothetical protein